MDPDSYLSVFSAIEVTPPSGGAILAIILAGLFLCVSAFVSASEIAYFSLSSEELHEFDDDESTTNVLVKKLLAKPEYLLATILISNNLVNVAIVILCNFFFSDILHFHSDVLDFIFQTILLTFLLLLFGEVMPKFYANQKPVKWVKRSCRGLSLLEKIFSPLANLLVNSTQIVNKHMVRKRANISMNELSQALEMTQVEANDEKEMLEGIIKFGGKTVQEVMTARVDITDVEIRTDFKELLNLIIETGYSRLPVYDTTEDDIKGIIYSKDLLPYIGQDASFNWRKLMRRAYFVPETKMIDDLLEEFRTKKIHMAIVVDEFGGTSGIVTMEDILEEIVGDISDEYDEEEKNYVKLDDNTYIFEGKTVLNDFYKITGLDESEFGDKAEDAETLAGLILDIKEDFPKVKEQIDYGRCSFVVLELDKRRIGKVKVKINPAAPQDE
ncbi:gliding motility-associated protein GldE [Barnesiella viscericola]|uniref:Gliding motility-associated protein GldE n=1 Tax=Barnesiella viscericola TaxID=397865 RepID=A0A921MQ15_9BACT|nr:gliding motility-associated protein GldE [Barnesiella viscericola]HJG88016.1 gliding motility-associated protein GldE [Barnesiella viscericola]